jgi:hypothetical protein
MALCNVPSLPMDPASEDFSELTRQAAHERKLRKRAREDDEVRGEGVVAAEKSRAAELLEAQLRACADELLRLGVRPGKDRDGAGKRRRGWPISLCVSERWDDDLVLWLDKDVKRWSAGRESAPLPDSSGALPRWGLIVGGGAGADDGGSVRVAVDESVDGGLRRDIALRDVSERPEPLRHLLARGVARLATDSGRL